MYPATLTLICLGLALSHSIAMGIGFLWGDLRASDYVNLQWIYSDEWRRLMGDPWGAWKRSKRKRRI